MKKSQQSLPPQLKEHLARTNASGAIPARVDADRTAKPLTRIVSHPKAGWCVGPGTVLVDPEFEAADILKRVDKVTVADVQQIAREVLNGANTNLAVIGPTKKKDIEDITGRLGDL